MLPEDTEKVYTLDDLQNWSPEGTSLAVIGFPIKHSLSPIMQNAALADIAKRSPAFADWRYYKFEIAPEQLLGALPVFHKKHFWGMNLTLPHKIIAYENLSVRSQQTGSIGAVNVLVRQDKGWLGHNTDGQGFSRAVREMLGRSLCDSNLIVLGAGGASRAIAATALSEKCRSLWIGNRDAGRLATLIERLGEYFPDDIARIHGFSLASPPADLPAEAIVVNATSLGLKPGDGTPFPEKMFVPGMVAYDTIYEPGGTGFLRAAQAAGVPAANGLSMLCWQGALALELWTHMRAPVDVMFDALKKDVDRRLCNDNLITK